MATIEIGNVYSTITDASLAALRAANESISVMTPNYQFVPSYKQGFWDGKTKFMKMSANQSKFPTGLLRPVMKAMKAVGERVILEDNRNVLDVDVPDVITLGHSKLGTITLRDYQLEAVRSGIDHTRGVVNVATNGGKTEIACGMIKCILAHIGPNQRIAFFTHSREILYQSKARIEERLGIKVGIIGDEEWVEEQVTIVMIPTVGKYLEVPKTLPKNAKKTKLIKSIDSAENEAAKKKLKQELSALEKEERSTLKCKVDNTKRFLDSVIGFIADEVHHASSDTWYQIFMGMENSFYRFGLTGTVDSSDEIGTMKLYGCTGSIFTKITNQFLIDNGYSAKPTIYLLKFKADKIRGGDYRDVVEEGIINCVPRNNVFVNKIVERANSGLQCLIIVAETSHGEVVQSDLAEAGLDPVFSHGKRTTKFRQEALQSFANGDIRVLIATPILDEGVDVSGINCLFLMAGGASMKKVLQRIGRGLRKKSDGSGVEVYDAIDTHNVHLGVHFKERLDVYKAEGFDIVEL